MRPPTGPAEERLPSSVARDTVDRVTATTARPVAVLCGGVGAARFLSGLVRVVDPARVTAIVNVGDDAVFHGLHVSPDLDTVLQMVSWIVDDVRLFAAE